MRQNHEPNLGLRNMMNMKKVLNIITVNRVVARGNNLPALNCPIGASYCPAEVISKRLSDGSIFRVKVHFDYGASHTLANPGVTPIIVERTQSETPIQLKTVTSARSATRTVAAVEVNDKVFTVIIVKSLNVDSRCMPIPQGWQQFQSNWAQIDTEYDSNLPQILLGSDLPTLQPLPALDDNHQVIQTDSARLMVSQLTGKYLATGHLTDAVTEVIYQDTDVYDDLADIIDQPSNGEVDDDPQLVHVRTVRSSRAPGENDILTVQSEDDSDNTEDETVYHSIEQVATQVHPLPTIDIPNL